MREREIERKRERKIYHKTYIIVDIDSRLSRSCRVKAKQ